MGEAASIGSTVLLHEQMHVRCFITLRLPSKLRGLYHAVSSFLIPALQACGYFDFSSQGISILRCSFDRAHPALWYFRVNEDELISAYLASSIHDALRPHRVAQAQPSSGGI